MTVSKPNYYPKAWSPNIGRLEVGISTRDLGVGHKHAVYKTQRTKYLKGHNKYT